MKSAKDSGVSSLLVQKRAAPDEGVTYQLYLEKQPQHLGPNLLLRSNLRISSK